MQFLNGLTQGLLFGVVGLAFTLVYATTRVFYLALGATFTFVPYVLLASTTAGLPWPIGIALALLVAALLGLLSEELIHWPLTRQRAPAEVHLIASLGAFLVVVQSAVLLWGNDARVLVAGVDRVFTLGELRLSLGQLLGAGTAITLLCATLAWLRLTDVGLRLRALASNAALASCFGCDVRRLRRLVFVIASVLVGAAALATARDVGFDPNVGLRAALVGAASSIVGGRASFGGAAVAGLLLGVLRAVVGWYTSTALEDAVTFAVLAGFLMFAPGGLAGLARGRARVEEQT